MALHKGLEGGPGGERAWDAEPLSGGGVWPEPDATLYIRREKVDDLESLPSRPQMLAGFLTSRGRPVATDQLMQLSIGGSPAYAWQYSEENRAIRLWVTGNENFWAFINFSCPLSAEAEFRQEVDQMIHGFSFSE